MEQRSTTLSTIYEITSRTSNTHTRTNLVQLVQFSFDYTVTQYLVASFYYAPRNERAEFQRVQFHTGQEKLLKADVVNRNRNENESKSCARSNRTRFVSFFDKSVIKSNELDSLNEERNDRRSKIR